MSRSSWPLVAAVVVLLVELAGLAVTGFPTDSVAVAVAIGAFGVAGGLILHRRPGNATGRQCLAIAGLGALGAVVHAYTLVGLPGADYAGWVDGWLWAPLVTLIVMVLPLRFPDGRLPSRRLRYAPWAAVGFAVTAAAGNAFVDFPGDGWVNPLAFPVLDVMWGGLRALAAVFGVAAVAGAISAVVIRFRRGDRRSRQQLKWFVGALVGSVAMIVVADWLRDLQAVIVPAGLALPPVAITIAILRHQLFDIDRVLSRTIVYATVTGILAATYAGSVVVLQTLARPIAPDSDLAVAGSTIAVAALFGPVRRRVQLVVDRRFNRRRYDAAVAVESFAQRLRDQVDLDEVATDLQATVVGILQPQSVSLWVSDRSAVS